MEIWNHFAFRKDLHPLTTQYILDHDLPYEYGEILSAIDISESDPHWKELSCLLMLENNAYLSETKFSKEELFSAEWLTVRSRWYYDYPQPENNYRNITYTEDEQCTFADCSIGLIQKDSFRFKRTPKWGKLNFCMTNWVYDELFVSPKAKELLESSNLQGFSFLNVMNKSGSDTLTDIYQMQIPYILPEGMIIDLKGRIREIFDCPICGRKKFRSNGRGQFVFKKDIFLNAPDFVKSAEWFGGGASASKLILISQKAYQLITVNKLDSSLVFEPIQLI